METPNTFPSLEFTNVNACSIILDTDYAVSRLCPSMAKEMAPFKRRVYPWFPTRSDSCIMGNSISVTQKFFLLFKDFKTSLLKEKVIKLVVLTSF